MIGSQWKKTCLRSKKKHPSVITFFVTTKLPNFKCLPRSKNAGRKCEKIDEVFCLSFLCRQHCRKMSRDSVDHLDHSTQINVTKYCWIRERILDLGTVFELKVQTPLTNTRPTWSTFYCFFFFLELTNISREF